MTDEPGPAEVRLPNDRTVRVVRTFRAPRELVYQAYTTPALLQRWLLGPAGWRMPVCEMDLRVGGAFRWRWRSDESGEEFGFHGTFLELEAPERIRHTEFFDPGDAGVDMDPGGATVTLGFERVGDATTLTTEIEYPSRDARDAALSTGMTDGMEASYRHLDELLEPDAGPR